MKKLSVSNLLGIKYLNIEDINLIFETATQFKEVINRPIKKVPSLRDITIANLFFENSTRTKLSFELAEKRLSADIINLYFSEVFDWLKKCESIFGFNLKGYNQIRMYTFLAERFLPYWFKKYTKALEWPVVYCDINKIND